MPWLVLGVGIVTMALLPTVNSSSGQVDSSLTSLSREEMRERLHWLLGESSVTRCAPELRIESSTRFDGYDMQRISYFVESQERVEALLLLPKELKPGASLVVCLHQTHREGMKSPAGLAGDRDCGDFAVDLVRRGLVCFVPEEFCFGDRIDHDREWLDTTAFYQRHPDWSAMGKAIWDVQRGLDAVLAMDGIEPKRVGVMGHSHGATTGLLLAALDDRIDATAVHCGPRLLRYSEDLMNWCRDDTRKYRYFPRLMPYRRRPADVPFDFDMAAALIMPRALLVLHNVGERQPTAAQEWKAALEALGESSHAGELESPSALSLFEGDHRFTNASRTAAYDFLTKRLQVFR